MKDQNFSIKTPIRAGRNGVTIAIPNWNHEYLLPRALISALAAVRHLRAASVEAEILVIDDGSRDGSPTLLRQLEALHFEDGLRVLARVENAGLGAARNLALREATFRYIAFLDADDELMAENLPTFYRAIRDTAAALVYGNLLSWATAGKKTMVSHESFRPQKMFKANHIGATMLCDREQMLDCGGYRNVPKLPEDWELNLHLATLGRTLVFVPIVFSIYYDLPDSLLKDTHEQALAMQAQMGRIFDQQHTRVFLPHNTTHLRYHPDIGYL